MNQKLAKLIVAGIASAYFLWCAYDPTQWHLIDGVNLLIHEAGHIVFRPFGEFMMIAGGSLFQVIMPLLFVGYFAYQRQVLFGCFGSILGRRKYSQCLRLCGGLARSPTSTAGWPGFNARLELSAQQSELASSHRKSCRDNSSVGDANNYRSRSWFFLVCIAPV